MQEPLIRRHPRDRERVGPAASDVAVIPRKVFVRQFAKDYMPGQHVTFIGPSGRGKTVLAGQCMVATVRANSILSAAILHGKIKDRDASIIKLSNKGFPFTTESQLSQWDKFKWDYIHRKTKRRGFIVRPLTRPEGSADSTESLTERENNHLHRVFKKTIYKCYHAPKKHPVILFVDEAHQAHNDLRLRKDCEGPLMRGRPVCGVWSLVQRGRYVSYMVYDQAEHVFIFYDPDVDNQRRYSEIGGVDPQLLRELSASLKTKTVADGSTISQCIYFRRSGNVLSIVDT